MKFVFENYCTWACENRNRIQVEVIKILTKFWSISELFLEYIKTNVPGDITGELDKIMKNSIKEFYEAIDTVKPK